MMITERLEACIDEACMFLGNEADPGIVAVNLKSVYALVCRYCRLKELPKELNSTIVQMAVNRYRSQSIGSSEEKQAVASVTDGQQSVSFRAPTTEEIIPATGFTQSEMNILNEYRKLWW